MSTNNQHKSGNQDTLNDILREIRMLLNSINNSYLENQTKFNINLNFLLAVTRSCDARRQGNSNRAPQREHNLLRPRRCS